MPELDALPVSWSRSGTGEVLVGSSDTSRGRRPCPSSGSGAGSCSRDSTPFRGEIPVRKTSPLITRVSSSSFQLACEGGDTVSKFCLSSGHATPVPLRETAISRWGLPVACPVLATRVVSVDTGVVGSMSPGIEVMLTEKAFSIATFWVMVAEPMPIHLPSGGTEVVGRADRSARPSSAGPASAAI